MAVDLGDLVESLMREVNPLGGDAFTNATEDMYLGYLQDAFWEARLDGITVLSAWDEADGSVTPITVGGADITRDLQQLLVFIAGVRIIRNQLINLNTSFRAKAGPVEYETEQSGNLLIALLKDLQGQRNIILTRLSDVGAVPSYYFDALVEREFSLGLGLSDYPSAGYGGSSSGHSGSYYGNGWY